MLASETGAVLDRVVIELPGDEPGEVSFPEEEPLSNAATEAEWAAAHHDLLRLLAAPAQFPELMAPGAPGVLPPALFCATSGRLFPIPCPRCFGPLRTCREDALLAVAGLPLYSATAARFLYCPSGHPKEEGDSPRFWAGTEAEARGLERVGTLEDLRREYGAALERAREEKLPLRLEDLPCATCPQPGHCGATPPAAAPASRKGAAAAAPAAPASGWTVFNLHDSPFLVTRLAPVAFDDFLARLGAGGGAAGAVEEGPGFLFAAEGSGIDAVEVLALKLAAFLQIVAAVRRHYLLLGRPHLDLQPGHLVVEPGPPAGFLPALWSFRVKLLGASPARLGHPWPRPRGAAAAARSAGPVRLARHPLRPIGEPGGRRAADRARGGGEGREGSLADRGNAPRSPRLLSAADAARPGPARLAAGPFRSRPRVDRPARSPVGARERGDGDHHRAAGARSGARPAAGAGRRLPRPRGALQDLSRLERAGGHLFSGRPAAAHPAGQRRAGALRARAADRGGAPGDGPSGARRPADRGGGTLRDARRRARAAGQGQPLPSRGATAGPAVRIPSPRRSGRACSSSPSASSAAAPASASPPSAAASYGFNEANPVAHLDEVQAEAEDLLRRLYGILFNRQTVHVEVQTLIAELLAEDVGPERKERIPTDRVKP